MNVKYPKSLDEIEILESFKCRIDTGQVHFSKNLLKSLEIIIIRDKSRTKRQYGIEVCMPWGNLYGSKDYFYHKKHIVKRVRELIEKLETGQIIIEIVSKNECIFKKRRNLLNNSRRNGC